MLYAIDETFVHRRERRLVLRVRVARARLKLVRGVGIALGQDGDAV